MRIDKKDSLAMVIDFQEKLIPVIDKKEILLHNTEILIKGLNVLEIPMVITQQYTKGLGMTVELLQNVFGASFQYFNKTTFSCCDDGIILEKIKSYQKKNIIICGIEAHICVQQTVIDCLAEGYQVIIVEDCISSRKENDKKIAIQRMIQEGAIITTYESILFELTRDSGNDRFKAISKLIK
ncbi:hydrolase [Anaerocolumna aminovalerica]|jgi:nicotinamidase-related amidase|uniref:hydrolase n=1 Tax=Anaerocolumna aminovalerica TaxID=1527 RepID=UPI001C0EB71D|nr:hydrolase [Anaerocolumna aminovalerica]MBU5334429.1 hydrolase [Anaerocolumna aminovalerica]